jgi:hypothetical protein
MEILTLRGALFVVLFFFAAGTVRSAERKTENLILITIDGVRRQEMFGGLDLEVAKSITKKGKVEETPVYKKYWAPAPEERRAKVMPFFWGTLLKDHGSIAGNQALGSTARITNKHRFSYPGYSEILTGEARDDVIDSNDRRQNPFPTVLEFLKKKLSLERSQVAAFASWGVLQAAVEHEKGSITANAGIELYPASALLKELSQLAVETSPWEDVRHDAFTFRYARFHQEAHKPRVLYISFDETDDFSHEGRYESVLGALERFDGYLKQLWSFLEMRDEYRGKTTIVITTDHGRGDTPADWKDHGKDVEGAQYIWIAFVSPDSSLRGEWSSAETVYQNQIAATLCGFLGLDYGEQNPKAGKPIGRLFKD